MIPIPLAHHLQTNNLQSNIIPHMVGHLKLNLTNSNLVTRPQNHLSRPMFHLRETQDIQTLANHLTRDKHYLAKGFLRLVVNTKPINDPGLPKVQGLRHQVHHPLALMLFINRVQHIS